MLSNQVVVFLLYYKKLDDEWCQEVEVLCDVLCVQNLNVYLIGWVMKIKIELDQDYIDECLLVVGKEMIYCQVENSFIQLNVVMNIQMLEWVLDVIKGLKGDLLELYCGNGNFLLVLVCNFDWVLVIEIVKLLVVVV